MSIYINKEMPKISKAKNAHETVTDGQITSLEELLSLINGFLGRPPGLDEIEHAPDVEDRTRNFILYGWSNVDEWAVLESDDESVHEILWGIDAHQRYQFLLEAMKVLDALKAAPTIGTSTRGRIPTVTFWGLVDGKIDDSPGELASVLRGIEIDKIRRCVACSRWFFARRKDKLACSSKCASLTRMREMRRQYAITRSKKRNGGKDGNL